MGSIEIATEQAQELLKPTAAVDSCPHPDYYTQGSLVINEEKVDS